MATITVTTTADADPDNTQTTLREAVEQANATVEADTIVFAEGISGAELSQGALTISSDIEIRGTAGNNTYYSSYVSANGTGRAFDVQDGELTIKYMDVGGGAADLGGAIYVAEDAGLTLDHTAFSNNTAQSGGAIYADRNAFVAVGTSFFTENNFTGAGGGAIATNRAYVVITSSRFYDNGDFSAAGGAILAVGGEVTIIGGEFVRNAAMHGGAIYASGTLLTVSDVEMNFNFSSLGGGLYATSSSIVTITNQSDIYNHDSFEGGGIYADRYSDITISDSRVRDNTAHSDGGGIHADNASLAIIRTDFEDNYADNGGAIYASHDDVTLLDSYLLRNSSINAGGSLAGDAINLTILGGQIDGSSLQNGLGAALSLKDSSGAFIRDTEFSAGSGPNNGAAINLDASDVSFLDVTLNNFGPDLGTANVWVKLPVSSLTAGQFELPDDLGTTVDVGALFGTILPEEITSEPLDFSANRPLTLLGTDAAENLRATDLDDTIFASGGDDIIDGSDGADFLFGGLGDDSIIGGAGNDTLDGGIGNDTLSGALGDDVYIFDGDSDTVTGEAEEDAGGGWDIVIASQSASIANGVEELRLGTFDDTFSASGRGNRMDNLLTGNAGDNSLYGADGNDSLYGGEGNDTLNGGDGADLLDGGTGDDTYVVDNEDDQILSEDGVESGYDTVLTWIDYVLPQGLEALEMKLSTTGTTIRFYQPWDGVGTATGNSANNSIKGNALNNTLSGLDGDDVLFGGVGVDTLFGGEGNDTLDGGLFRDFLYGDDGDDHLFGSFTDSLFGGAGNDVFTVEVDTVTIVEDATYSSGGGIDTIRSSVSMTLAQNVEILRLFGDDLDGTGTDAPNVLVGSDGSNMLVGRGGDDRLVGHAGNDRLIGNTGADTLVGGDGADVFVLTSIADSRAGRESRDFINGFDRGNDLIDFSAIDANRAEEGDQDWTFIGNRAFDGEAGQLRYFTFGGGNHNIVEADLNGDRAADLQVFVNGTHWMTGTDFVL